MMLPQRTSMIIPARLYPASAALLGTTVKVELDRQWPYEMILLVVNVTAGGTAPSSLTADGILKVVKRVMLTANTPQGPFTYVDCSGPGLLEYWQQVGGALDAATLRLLSEHTKGTPALTNSATYRIVFPIPLVHPGFAEPLRTRCLLPAQMFDTDPVLSIDFASASEMYGAGSLSAVTAEILTIRRQMPKSLHDGIVQSGGYVLGDLVETPFAIGTGISGVQRWQVPPPGQYTGLLLRHYLGGASVTRGDISERPESASNMATETRWTLEVAGDIRREWRNKHLQVLNEYSMTGRGIRIGPNFVAATTGGSPTISIDPFPSLGANPGAATVGWRDPATVFLDFFADSLGADGGDLGSLLDVNLPNSQGLKAEIVGSVASVATNGSTLYMVGHRLYGDLTRYQPLRAA